MKPLLNTLYVMTEGAYLSREGETVLVQVERETKLQVPIHTLRGVVCMGRVSVSPYLMALCAEREVGVSFLSEHGRFLARVVGEVNGNVLLRREQYRRADSEEASKGIVKAVVAAKIANSRNVLMRAAREREDGEGVPELKAAAGRMAQSLLEIEHVKDVDQARGIEGEAASVYFGTFDRLITGDKENFRFRGRNRRPPLDRVNALLSFLYTVLMHDVVGALESVGLDPAVGFLHRDRPGRAGLGLDLMEEFRAMIVDRLVLTLVNRRQVKASGFETTESGAVMMDKETRREVLTAYQLRKQEEVEHPFLKERIPIGMLPHAQAMLLARHLRGDLEAYPAYFWR